MIEKRELKRLRIVRSGDPDVPRLVDEIFRLRQEKRDRDQALINQRVEIARLRGMRDKGLNIRAEL